MTDFIAYIKVVIFFLTLAITGTTILRRFTNDNKPQLIIPSGLLFGIGLYIFLINSLSHIIKGIPVLFLALIIQIGLAYFLHFKFPIQKFNYPKGKSLFYLTLSILFWSVFLYQITAHSWVDGADSTIYYSLAARFIRGDYPMHYPTQPDYIAYNHIGAPELLGTLRALIGTPYYSLHAFLAFIILLSISQVLTWLFEKRINNFFDFIIISLPPVSAVITLGSLMFAFLVSLHIPQFDNGFLKWLGALPTLSSSFEQYGAPTNLDALVLFIHRLLSTSLFIGLLIPLLYPRNKFTAVILGILIATIALVDESVFLIIFIPTLILIFFTVFKKSIKHWLIFSFFIILLISIQGGVITETLLNRYNEKSSVLFFPSDGLKDNEKYRSYRLSQQDNRIFSNENYNPFIWIHPAIYLQILFLLILILKFSKSSSIESEKKLLIWILFLSSLTSFIAYHAIVPKGYSHQNGNRFLALSFYISGLGIAFCISWFLETRLKNILLSFIIKGLVIWILITSIIPPFAQFFPRKKDNFLIFIKEEHNPIFEWIKNNIDKDKRLLAMLEPNPISIVNLKLATQIGVLTPQWSSKIRVYDSFDWGPTYADFYYTLNPQVSSLLGINYILTSSQYRFSLPKERQTDLTNPYFFKPAFIDSESNIIIYEILDNYLNQGQNLGGTFTQLDSIAPHEGTYFIDYPPNISEHVFRILILLFNNRNIHCDRHGSFYNSRIDIDLNTCKEFVEKYDYLLLGEYVDPKKVCSCNATLIWTGLSNGVKFWKTNQ